jgi:hypothetical protein
MTKSPSDARCFYVYGLFDADGIIRYIGKGKGRRWLLHEKKRPDKRNWAKYEFIIATLAVLGEIPKVKIRENLTEPEAFEIETALINAIGRFPDGPLINRTNGGDGMSGFKHSPSTIEALSERRKKFWERMTPQERREFALKSAAGKTSEERRASGRKGAAQLPPGAHREFGLKSAASFTPEERSLRLIKAFSGLSPEDRKLNGLKGAMSFDPEDRRLRAKTASAAMDPEKRREAGKVLAANMTLEQRSEAGRKGAAAISKETRKIIGIKAAATKRARGCLYDWAVETRWINDGNQTRRLKHSELLPEGWAYGRKLNRTFSKRAQ